MREESITKNLKVILTEAETNELARKMAKAQGDLMAAQDRKAELTSELNAQIKRHHAAVQEYSRVIGNGYVFRDIDCRVVYDHPEPNFKTIIRLDDCSEVESCLMDDNERQLSIKFYERTAEAIETETSAEENPAAECSTCHGAPMSGDLLCPDCHGKRKEDPPAPNSEEDKPGNPEDEQ